MREHKFAIGQAVTLMPDNSIGQSGGTRFTVVRLLPEQNRIPQYQIKSAVDGGERRVLENQLERRR